MKFEQFFRIVSYATVFCGFLSLWISGTFGPVATGLFIVVFAAAYLLEDSRYQIGEKLGTALIVLALPLFYGLWYTNIIAPSGSETWIAGFLARMILCLTGVKLLQKKSDRDWIFLYLMVFFQVLLAAGLSISGLYLVSFIAYLLVMTCAIVAFEIRKTSRAVQRKMDGTVADKRSEISSSELIIKTRRVPSAAVALIVFIVMLAIPLFFVLPRVGGAGLGSDQRGLTMSGFSDRVTLGNFGRIVENDTVVMRVRLEGSAAITNKLYFRGVALDTFDNKTWSRSRVEPKTVARNSRGTINLAPATDRNMLVEQTVYLEPLDTAVIFAMPKPVAIQGNFPQLSVDPYGALSHMRSSERISYRVASDVGVPSSTDLRADDAPYAPDVQNYRSLPVRFDPKIAELAESVTKASKNRYDKALAIEGYLQNNFGYTLEQKAGGAEPLADFLLNVREGHCEYFATAMAMMLRTQGIATRIVNGFHGGDYNDAVGLTVVRQSHAHAWVEVYFPENDVWITFDPTPFSGQPGGGAASGFTATVSKYLEALESVWIQYFVAFDDQGQRSMGRSVRDEFLHYQSTISQYLGLSSELFSEWLAEVRGDNGLRASVVAVLWAGGILAGLILAISVGIWLIKKIAKLEVWRQLLRRWSGRHRSSIEFYERMVTAFAARGIVRQGFQTPLEFAYSVGDPGAVMITERYQSVRFGGTQLSEDETLEIGRVLDRIESEKRGK
jgi:protein-glutamine gamma-glutamyltransferase